MSRSRRLSWPGLVVMLVGLGTLLAELRFNLMTARVGPAGYVLALIIGGSALLIGLQFLLVGLIPSLAASRGTATIARNRFFLPAEGRIAIIILIVLFIGAMIGRNNPLLLVFALLATPFILNGFSTFTLLQKMEVSRSLPDRAEAGRPVAIDVRLHNRRRWLPAWLMTVRDEVRGIGQGATGHDQTALFPQVTFLKAGPRSTPELTYRLRLPERGRYRFGPCQLNTRFPIGLVERGLILGVSDDLLVHPRVGKLSASWQRRLKKGTELVASAARQSGSFDDDFHRVREYQQGDDPRAIHWPTTARRGELIVREFRESRDRPLAVLVDLYRSPDGRRAAPTTESTDPADPADPAEPSLWDRLYNVIVPSTDAGAGEVEAPEVLDSRVETALAMAATLCVDHLRNSQQSHVYCAVAAADPIAWDSSTRADLGGLLDRMAEAQPHGQASADSGSMLVDDWQLRRRRSEQVVWITTRPEAALPAADLPSDLIIVPAEESVVRELVAF